MEQKMKKCFLVGIVCALCMTIGACSFYAFTQTPDVPEDMKSEIIQLDEQIFAMISEKDTESLTGILNSSVKGAETEEQLDSFVNMVDLSAWAAPEYADMRLVDVKKVGDTQISVETNIGDVSFTPLVERNIISILRMESDESWLNLILFYGLTDTGWECMGMLWNYPMEEAVS